MFGMDSYFEGADELIKKHSSKSTQFSFTKYKVKHEFGFEPDNLDTLSEIEFKSWFWHCAGFWY